MGESLGLALLFLRTLPPGRPLPGVMSKDNDNHNDNDNDNDNDNVHLSFCKLIKVDFMLHCKFIIQCYS